MTALQDTAAPCRRCKAPDAPYNLRSLPTCRGCVVEYVESKVVKRFGVLTKETRTPPTSTRPAPRRFLAGLSFGASSSALAQLLDKTAEYHASRKASSPFEPLVVHVDTDFLLPASSRPTTTTTPAEQRLDRYRARFPHVQFECVRLTTALYVNTLDWSALPLPPLPHDTEHNTGDVDANDDERDAQRLRRLFDALPSASSRADILRLLVRHVLLHVARERSYSALLLAHSATALASLTLAQVAGGRGFAVPGAVNDGLLAVCTYEQAQEREDSNTGRRTPAREVSRTRFPVYYPMRELLKNEILLYMDLVPSLEGLLPASPVGSLGGSGSGGAAVVSHRDLSIEEVMARYFDSVEGPHSGIIANVVRITGKLERPGGDELCRLCGTALDEDGDSRWAGELGDTSVSEESEEVSEHHQDPADVSKLCYGCKRSING